MVGTGSRIVVWRIVQKAAGALVVVLLAGHLGPAGQGYFSLTMMVAMVVAALLNGGMGLAAVPPLRQRTLPARRLLVAQACWLGLLALVLAAVVLAVQRGHAWSGITRHLGWDRFGLVATAAATLALVAFDIHTYDLLATGRLVTGTIVNAGRAIAQLAGVAVLVLVGSLNLRGAIGVYAAVQVGAAVALAILAVRALSGRAEFASAPSIPRLVGWCLRHGWLGQLSAVAYLLLLRVDQGFLEFDHGAAAVGIYSVAVWAGEMLWMLPEALNPFLVHSSADVGDPHVRDATAARAVRLGLTLTAVGAVFVALLAGPVFGWLFRGSYAASAAPLRALLPGIVCFAPGAVLAGDFIGRGRSGWNTQASAATVAANVALCLAWIPTHGAVGAAWASSVAYAVGSTIMLVRFRSVTQAPWRDLLVPRMGDLKL